jgi:hypothetical protein
MPAWKRFTLRLPPELHQLLVERADAEDGSLNREMEYLLWEAFRVDVDAFANTPNRGLLVGTQSERSVRPVASGPRTHPVRTSLDSAEHRMQTT